MQKTSVLLLAVIVSLPLSGCATTSSSEPFDPFETLEARWGQSWGSETCNKNPQTIRFSKERDLMYVSFPQARRWSDDRWVTSATYDVVGKNPDGVLIVRMQGETRTIHGDPVVFRIRIFDGDRFYWEETDIETAHRRGGFYRWGTRPMIRCR